MNTFIRQKDKQTDINRIGYIQIKTLQLEKPQKNLQVYIIFESIHTEKTNITLHG